MRHMHISRAWICPGWLGNVCAEIPIIAQITRSCGKDKNRWLHGGYDFPVDPDIDALNARLFWNPSVAPAAVGYVAPVPGDETPAPLIDEDDLTVIGTQDGQMYVRLPTGALVVLDAKTINRSAGILLPLDEHWTVRLEALKSLHAQLTNRKRSVSPLTMQQRRRILLALRTLDARRDSASYQQIARHLFGADAVSREHWKTSSLKAQIIRLSAHGTHLTNKGYRLLLLGRGPTGQNKRRK